MKLSRSQKKFLKKNSRKLTLAEIAPQLGVEEKQLQEYLKSIWSKEKYRKFLTKQKQLKIRERVRETKKSNSSPRDKGLKSHWKVLAFLAFLVFTVYFNSLGNEFVSDDIPAILENEHLGDFFFLAKERPLNFLRYLFYFLAYRIGGKNPLLFRLLDVFFHLGSVWTIFAIIALLYTPFLALMVAALFAVHPILSEAIVWISGGVHGQYVFFVLLAFLFYLKARFNNWHKAFYFAAILSFLGALLTTEKAAALALLLFAFEVSKEKLRENWKRLIPFFSLSALWALLVIYGGFLSRRVNILQSAYFREGGLHNPLEQIPTAIASYLKLIFWPDKLTLYHSEMSFNFFQYSVNVLITLIFLGAIVYSFFKEKYREYFFWLSFFVLSLLPMLIPFKVAWIVAERYIYLGALGIFVVVGFLIQKLAETIKNKKIIYAILAVVLLSLSLRTIARNADWKNHETLWLAAAKTSPSSAQNHNNLGDLYGRKGDLRRALEEFQIAIKLQPDYADAYHNLANTYQQMGEIEEAIGNYQKAIEFGSHLWQSHQNLAVIYFEQGDFELARQALEKAIQINPENSDLYINLGVVYLKLGKEREAAAFVKKALQIDPENQRAKQMLGLE